MAETVVDIIIRATNKTKAALTAPITDLKSMQAAFNNLKPAIIGGLTAAAGAVALLTKSSIDSADEINKMSQKVGISTESLSTLAYAAKLANVPMEELQKGLGKLNKAAFEAAAGNAAAQDAFKNVGVSVKDLAGNLKAPDRLLLDIAEKFKQMPDGARKTALAMQVFGKSGAELIPLLNQGSAGIAELQAKARSLGLEISGKTAAQAEAFNDAMLETKAVVSGAGLSIAGKLLPGLLNLVDKLNEGKEKGGALRDVFQATIEVVVFLGKVLLSTVQVLATAFNVIGTGLAGLAAAHYELVHGNFTAAKNIVKESLGDIKKDFSSAGSELSNIWKEKTDKDVAATRAGNRAKMDSDQQYAEETRRLAEEEKKRQQALHELEIEGYRKKTLEIVRLKVAELEAKKRLTVQEIKDLEKLHVIEKELGHKRVETTREVLTTIASLSNSKNHELAALGKAAAITMATIDGYLAVQKALAYIPPPFNYIAAAAVGVATAANVAGIAGVEGFEGGGVLGGTHSFGDRIPFMGNAGEVILNSANQANLANELAGADRPQVVDAHFYLEGDPLFRALGRASRNGRLVLQMRPV